MISEAVVSRALQLLAKRDVNYAAFFDRLTSPEWIEPLQARGFFKDPPPAEREGDWLRFPIWPESRYLVRMAEDAPVLVLSIILGMSETDNARVHEDLVAIAQLIPVDLSVRVAERECAWVSKQEHLYLLLGYKYANLINKLATSQRGDTALRLAEQVLRISASPNEEVRALLRDWDYAQVIDRVKLDLVDATGIGGLNVLLDLLAAAIEGTAHGEKPEDFSYIWRRELGPAPDEERERAEDIRNALISAIRDAADRLAHRGRVTVFELIQKLEQREWNVFQRLALYLLLTSEGADKQLVTDRVTDRARLRNSSLRHELLPLLSHAWPTLSQTAQASVLSFVEDEGARVANEQGQEHGERRVLGWLSQIAEHLQGAWRDRYENLRGRFGRGHMLEAWSGIKMRWGSSSPIDAQSINAMSSPDLVGYLNEWKSEDQFEGPDVDGLRAALTQALAENPNQHLQDISIYTSLDPGYLPSIIYGLRQAITQGTALDWPNALSICEYALARATAEHRGTDQKSPDDFSGSIKHATVDLLRTAFEGDPSIPYDLRGQTWSLLHMLVEDPEPSPEYERAYGGSNMDPITLSINTIRGQAMHSVIRYALWVRRRSASGDVSSLDDIPEVRGVLDRHLDAAVDPSEAVRSVFGQWIPWLQPLDSAWFRDSVQKIFPHDPESFPLWRAAWEGYVLANPPYKNIFAVLASEYEFALDNISRPPGDRRELADPRDRLAEHLMSLLWANELQLNSSIVQRFYSLANADVRQHALAFLGRSLASADEIADETLTRINTVWQSRLDYNRSLPRSARTELAAFGWWFVSKKVDSDASLTALASTLELFPKIDVDDRVMSRLSELAGTFPMQVLRCARMLIEGSSESWQIDLWRESLEALLRAALDFTHSPPGNEARQLINDLAARGFLKYLELLDTP